MNWMRHSPKLTVAAIGLALCLPLLPLGAWVVTLFIPHRYTCEAAVTEDVVQVSQVQKPPPPEAYTYPVIDRLGLVDKWSAGLASKISREEASARLWKMTAWGSHAGDEAVQRITTITVTDADTQEAADIANAFAEVYLQKWNAGNDQAISGAMKSLAAEVDEERAKVDAAKADLDKIRTRDNIQDAEPDLLQAGVMDAVHAERDAKAALDDAKARVDAMQAQVTKIDKLSFDDLITAMPNLKTEDATVAKLYRYYESAGKSEADLKKSGVGEDDDRYRSLEQNRNVWRTLMQQSIDNAKKSMQAQVDAKKTALLDPAQKAYDDAAAHLQGLTTFSGDYIAAKETYIEARDALAAATQKYDAGKTTEQTQHPPMEITEQATAATAVAHPDVPRIVMTALRIGFLCALAGAGLFYKFGWKKMAAAAQS